MVLVRKNVSAEHQERALMVKSSEGVQGETRVPKRKSRLKTAFSFVCSAAAFFLRVAPPQFSTRIPHLEKRRAMARHVPAKPGTGRNAGGLPLRPAATRS
jgi:hypothetical protein